jgi:hypothetical protein
VIESSLWWQGPSWLSKDKMTARKTRKTREKKNQREENRKVVLVSQLEPEIDIKFLERISKYNRLVTFIACCFRFANNCKAKNEDRKKSQQKKKSMQKLQSFEQHKGRNFRRKFLQSRKSSPVKKGVK